MQHQFAGRSTLFKAAIIIDETSGSSSSSGRRRSANDDAITNNQYHVCLPRDQIYHMPRLPSPRRSSQPSSAHSTSLYSTTISTMAGPGACSPHPRTGYDVLTRLVAGFHPHPPSLLHRGLAKALGASMWFFIFYRAR